MYVSCYFKKLLCSVSVTESMLYRKLENKDRKRKRKEKRLKQLANKGVLLVGKKKKKKFKKKNKKEMRPRHGVEMKLRRTSR